MNIDAGRYRPRPSIRRVRVTAENVRARNGRNTTAALFRYVHQYSVTFEYERKNKKTIDE